MCGQTLCCSFSDKQELTQALGISAKHASHGVITKKYPKQLYKPQLRERSMVILRLVYKRKVLYLSGKLSRKEKVASCPAELTRTKCVQNSLRYNCVS